MLYDFVTNKMKEKKVSKIVWMAKFKNKTLKGLR